jgi:HD-GYP domain-containing protein (c-di-GMP phosphodiesterase class II)
MIEIVVISDIFDALLMKRPYRATSYDTRTALEEITEQARQGKIDWEVVQVLVACNRRNKPHYRDCSVSLEKRGVPPTDNNYGVLVPENAS